MTRCKGHPLEAFCCGDIMGYYCDLFLGHSVFDALFGVPFNSHHELKLNESWDV